MAENNRAKQRWKILRALVAADEQKLSELLLQPGSGSKRSQPTFRVFETNVLQQNSVAIVKQYGTADQPQLFLIRELIPRVKVQESFGPYSGFLNTGNICIWPAEELLAFYIAKHPELVRGQTVIELGGGMTAMAGVAAATVGGATSVLLTDGNPDCVANLTETAQLNHCSNVSTRQLLWSTDDKYDDQADVVLVADCLYVKDLHDALLHVLESITKPGSRSYILAPRRGGSLVDFVAKVAQRTMFTLEQIERYDETIWQQHEHWSTSPQYDTDTHYPILLILSRH